MVLIFLFIFIHPFSKYSWDITVQYKFSLTYIYVVLAPEKNHKKAYSIIFNYDDNPKENVLEYLITVHSSVLAQITV